MSKDNSEAFKWYFSAAELGNVSAQLIVGNRYALGDGVVRNYENALQWYYKAANQSNHKARMAIVHLCTIGSDVLQNDTRTSSLDSIAQSRAYFENREIKGLLDSYLSDNKE